MSDRERRGGEGMRERERKRERGVVNYNISNVNNSTTSSKTDSSFRPKGLFSHSSRKGDMTNPIPNSRIRLLFGNEWGRMTITMD